ncbi:MAG: O-antigen ligase family protein [Patescibacteria group bacterium]
MFFKASKFFLHATVFNVAIVTLSTLFPFIVGKYVWFRTSIDLALIAFLLGLVFSSEEGSAYLERMKKLFKTPIGITVTVFAAAFVIAGFFGIDPSFSFWSNFERGEGGFQMLHLATFFVLLATLFTKEKDWQKFFWYFMIAAALVILYGVGASLKFVDAETTMRISDGVPTKELTGKGGPYYQIFQNFIGSAFSDPGFRFAGSIGNPAYTATYLLFAFFFALYLLIWSKRPFRSLRSWVIIGFVVLFFSFFILAATRGAFLGFAAGTGAGMVYLIATNKKLRPWLIALAILMCVVLGTLIRFKDSSFVQGLPFGRIFDISFTTETFEDRAIMWSIAWDAFKERPVFGYGPENFIFAFDRHFNPKYFVPDEGFGAWFDRAHSFVFDYLAETGLVGFLSYLGVFVAAFWHLLRRKSNIAAGEEKPETHKHRSTKHLLEKVILIAIPVGHLVQGLVLFEVLVIYMSIFIFFAFLAYKFALPADDLEIEKNEKKYA